MLFSDYKMQQKVSFFDSGRRKSLLYRVCENIAAHDANNMEEVWGDFMRIKDYVGLMSVYFMDILSDDIGSIFNDVNKTRETLDAVALLCARLIGFNARFRHSTSVSAEAVEFLRTDDLAVVDYFVERLLHHCINTSQLAVTNFIASTWYNETLHSSIFPERLKLRLESRGGLPEVVTDLVGKKNVTKVFRRFGWEELASLATAKDRRGRLEMDLSL